MFRNLKINKKRSIDKTIAIIVVLIGFFLIFFPHYIYDGCVFLGFKIDINKYDEFSTFLSAPIGIFSIYLIYKTYVTQKEELQLSTQTLRQQQFETSLFNLLELLNRSISNLKYDVYYDNSPSVTVNSDSYIGHFYFKFKTDVIKHAKENDAFILQNLQHVSNYFDLLVQQKFFPDALIQHLKNIENIYILFTYSSYELNYNDYWFYSSLVMSNMKKHESLLFVYFVFSRYKFKDTQTTFSNIYRYHENFTSKDLIDSNHYTQIPT